MLGIVVCGRFVEDQCVEGHSVEGCGDGGCCEGSEYMKNVVGGVIVGTV